MNKFIVINELAIRKDDIRRISLWRNSNIVVVVTYDNEIRVSFQTEADAYAAYVRVLGELNE